MSDDESPVSTSLTDAVTTRLLSGLDAFLEDSEILQNALADAQENLPTELLEQADLLLQFENVKTGRGRRKKLGLSYRDGLLIQLAWGLQSRVTYDHTLRGEGARTVAQALGSGNHLRHIPKVNDAYENIGKNQPNLARGNVKEFDELLHWMNAATDAQRTILLNYGLARTASTARAVLKMPKLRPVELTFARVMALVDDLLSRSSGGADQQFAVAAFLGAMLDQFGSCSLQGLQVRTKNINASDASAGAAADVQIMRGGLIEAVFEVSANDWRGKLDQAVEAAKRAGLPAAHIVADGVDAADLGALLSGSTVDVTVTEIGAFLGVICAVLRPPAREDALRRLYDLLDRLQSDVALTNDYVRLLRSHGLAAE